MTHRLFILDVPENIPLTEVAAAAPEVTLERLGPYFVIASDSPIVIDRRETGCRHAVWYSCVAGVADCRIEQWDKDALRLGAR